MCWTRCGKAWLFHKCVPLSGFGCRQFLNYSNDSRGQGQTEIRSYLSAGCKVTVNSDSLSEKEIWFSAMDYSRVSVFVEFYLRSRKEWSLHASCPIGEIHRDGTNDY